MYRSIGYGERIVGRFNINVQRVYEPLPGEEVKCFLVDRLWPRGVPKQKLAHVDWAKDAAPSTALRTWLHGGRGDAARWIAFVQRYKAELKANPDGWRSIVEASGTRDVMLLYGAHDTQRNHALVQHPSNSFNNYLAANKAVGA